MKITFFMIVTDPDIVIADYCVRSYAKIEGIRFKLRVYSNWVSSALKRRYFPGWRKLAFVEIVENEWQTDDSKPTDRRLEGPFERYNTIWDRELRKIDTPYHATVHADFEILDAKFIPVMLAHLNNNPNVVAMSHDYNPKIPVHYESYSDDWICLNERWKTSFCIYKRAALQCTVSHAYYEEITPGPVRRNAWDSGAYFQKTLKDRYGFELAVLEDKYQPCFVHYDSFSKNRHINESNVALYRRIEILRKRGMFGTGDFFSRKVAHVLSSVFFAQVDRRKHLPGWGRKE